MAMFNDEKLSRKGLKEGIFLGGFKKKLAIKNLKLRKID